MALGNLSSKALQEKKKVSTPKRKAFNEEKLQKVGASCKPSKSGPSEKLNKKDANANPSKKESTKRRSCTPIPFVLSSLSLICTVFAQAESQPLRLSC